MNFPDESWLSAYADGELDPDARRTVEAALPADPALSERLHELTSVRGLVGGLARPTAPADVSSAVMARIETLPITTARRIAGGPRRRLGWGLGLAVAASIALMVALPRFLPTPGPAARDGGRPAVVRVTPTPVAPVAVAPTGTRPAPVAVRPAPAPTAVTVLPAARPNPSETERREAQERERFASLLARPVLRRVSLMLDSIGTRELQDMDKVLEQTHRLDPVRVKLHVVQGALTGDAGAKEALVYVVVMTDDERTEFESRVRRLLKTDPIAQGPVAPELVAELSEVGSLEISDTPTVPTLGPRPGGTLAQKAVVHRNGDTGSSLPSPLTVPPGVRRAPNGRTPADETENRPGTVYIVWLTTVDRPSGRN